MTVDGGLGGGGFFGRAGGEMSLGASRVGRGGGAGGAIFLVGGFAWVIFIL